MNKTTGTTDNEINTSVMDIYGALMAKKAAQKEERIERKRLEREARKKEKEDKKNQEDQMSEQEKLSKKERREIELNGWKDLIQDLTGDDADFAVKKTPKKKKYRKWIDEDDGIELKSKPKKKKKKNYQKEFEPELNMLRRIVADQNRFTADLQKRFQNAAGPATKDASPLNKTLVDLAANINTSRSNSLGMLNAIGNLKKTIATLYMDQKKLDAKNGGDVIGSTDLGLLGSNIASSILGESGPAYTSPSVDAVLSGQTQVNITPDASVSPAMTVSPQINNTQVQDQTHQNVVDFDPSSWDGPDLGNSSAMFETIPHELVVDWDKQNQTAEFKAIRTDTGEVIPNYPVPHVDPSKLVFNETDKTVKGEFDETYKLRVI